MAAEPTSDEPLSLSEAAEHLGIPGTKLVELVHRRKIPRVYVDGIWHVTPQAIEEYRRRQAS